MLDLESMIFAERIICLKKYIENYESPWKYALDFYLKKVGGKFYYIVILIVGNYPFACKPGLLGPIMIRQPIQG